MYHRISVTLCNTDARGKLRQRRDNVPCNSAAEEIK
jgi:hypothetical protein